MAEENEDNPEITLLVKGYKFMFHSEASFGITTENIKIELKKNYALRVSSDDPVGIVHENGEKILFNIKCKLIEDVFLLNLNQYGAENTISNIDELKHIFDNSMNEVIGLISYDRMFALFI